MDNDSTVYRVGTQLLASIHFSPKDKSMKSISNHPTQQKDSMQIAFSTRQHNL